MRPAIAICLTSHDRLDCTRINQEIFKLNFSHPYIVVHASSGAAATPYLEDAFVRRKPLSHFAGAISLMQTAIGAARRFRPDFLVLLDGDTWLLEEDVLLKYIRLLQADPSLLMATCAWRTPAHNPIRRLAREVIDILFMPDDRGRRLLSLPRRMRYDAIDFCTQFLILRNDRFLLDLFCSLQPVKNRLVERLWFDRFCAHFDLRRVFRMREREPVHPHQRFRCDPLSLHGEHWPAAGTAAVPEGRLYDDHIRPETPGKREALERYSDIRKGKYIQKLLQADDFSYYNPGAKRC